MINNDLKQKNEEEEAKEELILNLEKKFEKVNDEKIE